MIYLKMSATVLFMLPVLLQTIVAVIVSGESCTVSLRNLPRVFDGTSLQKNNEPQSCFQFVGCMRNQLNHGSPEHWEEIGIEFSIHTRERSSYIKFRDVENCTMQPRVCSRYPFNLEELYLSDFDPHRKTVILIAGYMSGNEDRWRKSMREKWLMLEDANVIVVSWKDGSHEVYNQAVLNTRVAARQITLLIYYLALVKGFNPYDQGYLNKIHIVGHSLGGHIAGFVGDDFRGRIGRITALDPAGPLFNEKGRDMKLDLTDAQLVEAIHTNGSSDTIPGLGHMEPLGHVDYYANNGTTQPHCIDPKKNILSFFKVACSHGRAPKIFVFLLHAALEAKYNPLLKHHLTTHSHRGRHFQDYLMNKMAFLTKKASYLPLPLNFFGPFHEWKEHLSLVHGISFDPSIDPQNKFFFETSGSPPYLHSLIEHQQRGFDNSNTKDPLRKRVQARLGRVRGKVVGRILKNY